MARRVPTRIVATVGVLGACHAASQRAPDPVAPVPTVALPVATQEHDAGPSIDASTTDEAGQFELVLPSTAWLPERCGTHMGVMLPFEGRMIVGFEDQEYYVEATGDARPATDLFEGLPFPKPAVGVALLDLTVDGAALSLSLVACNQDSVAAIPPWLPGRFVGRPGRWSVAPKARPDRQRPWPPPNLLGLIDTPEGGLFVEVASAGHEGRHRYRFIPYGGVRSPVRKPPRPAPGQGDCAQAMLGHGFLKYLPDGTLVGVGTLCQHGSDPLTLLFNDRSGIWYLGGPGPLGVETWSGGSSRVDPLPGAEKTSGNDVVIAEAAPGDRWVTSRVVDAAGHTQSYVARFDGTGWVPMTPPDASPDMTLLSAPTLPAGTLLLLDRVTSYRWTGGRLEPIAMPDPASCEERVGQQFTEGHSARATSDGTVWMSYGKCILSIAPRGVAAELHPLPGGEVPGGVVYLLGDLPIVEAEPPKGASGGSLYRWKPREHAP